MAGQPQSGDANLPVKRSRDFSPDVDLRRFNGDQRPSDEAADPAHTFAVVVGIDRYPGLGDLFGACNDARDFHEWAVDPAGGGVPKDNARLLLSRQARSLRGARPLKYEIDRDLNRFVAIARQATVPTRLYLFFAGHGIAPAGSTAAGVMANAVPTGSRCWNLSFTAYQTWLERCRDFSEVVMFSDCCRTRFDGPAGAPQHDVCAPARRYPHQSLLVAHATDMDGRAFETPAGGFARGFFTSALIDGLEGAPADPLTGDVHASNLAAFLDREVRRRSDGRQFPDIRCTYPPLVLAHHASRHQGFPVTVQAPDGTDRRVQIVGGDLRSVAEASTAGGSFTVTLANGLYELRDPGAPPVPFRVEGRPLTVGTRALVDA
jgi:hypothetical protein